MMKHIILYLIAFLPLLEEAESVRDITISADKPYTDNFTLARESGDMDVMIKFSFDEENNQVTVSMTSYRGLFVFRENVNYKSVVKCGKLKVKNLPYVAEDGGLKYKMPYKFRKQLGKNRKSYVFQRWLNYTGLLPEPMEYQMVNDVLEQKFGVVGDKRTKVTITVGDVMIMEPKTNCLKQTYYKFLQYAHVNTRYNITIERNPCFQMEEQITIAGQQKTAVLQAYDGLRNTFPDHTTNLQETFDLFNKTKEMLTQQFPKRDSVSECPRLQELYDSINIVVDSIAAYKCKLVVKSDSVTEVANPGYLLSVAYQIDMKVSRWLLISDQLERNDIIKLCNEKIDDVNQYIRRLGLHSQEMKEANAVLQKAIRYYKTTCHIRTK